jgi:hypothetical protein
MRRCHDERALRSELTQLRSRGSGAEERALCASGEDPLDSPVGGDRIIGR